MSLSYFISSQHILMQAFFPTLTLFLMIWFKPFDMIGWTLRWRMLAFALFIMDVIFLHTNLDDGLVFREPYKYLPIDRPVTHHHGNYSEYELFMEILPCFFITWLMKGMVKAVTSIWSRIFYKSKLSDFEGEWHYTDDSGHDATMIITLPDNSDRKNEQYSNDKEKNVILTLAPEPPCLSQLRAVKKKTDREKTSKKSEGDKTQPTERKSREDALQEALQRASLPVLQPYECTYENNTLTFYTNDSDSNTEHSPLMKISLHGRNRLKISPPEPKTAQNEKEAVSPDPIGTASQSGLEKNSDGWESKEKNKISQTPSLFKKTMKRKKIRQFEDALTGRAVADWFLDPAHFSMRHLLKHGESDWLEFKAGIRKTGQMPSEYDANEWHVAKALLAMANTEGGLLVLGVEEPQKNGRWYHTELDKAYGEPSIDLTDKDQVETFIRKKILPWILPVEGAWEVGNNIYSICDEDSDDYQLWRSALHICRIEDTAAFAFFIPASPTPLRVIRCMNKNPKPSTMLLIRDSSAAETRSISGHVMKQYMRAPRVGSFQSSFRDLKIKLDFLLDEKR